ncbi:MAG: MMPL family transporter [Propionibacteriaceae bacterium]|nr:MMPL family transporter [Propionibacteriaceae bacterium]
MFKRLGWGVAHHPWITVVAWLAVFVVAGIGAFAGFGQGGLFDRMSNSMSLVSGSQSDEVNEAVTPPGSGEQISVVVTGVDLAAQQQQVAAFMNDHRADFTGSEDVAQEVDPFQLLASQDPAAQAQAQAMISTKQDGFLIFLTLKPNLSTQDGDAADSAATDVIARFSTALASQFPGASATGVSTMAIGNAIVDQVQGDLVIGEAVSLPVALVLLLIVFGGVVAAGLPLVGAIISIVVGLGAVWGLTFATTVDSFILNIISIIGLALSIDYGLLVVSRYREELAAGLDAAGLPTDGSSRLERDQARTIVGEAVQRTVATAGRTVTFSAVTIACAMAALLTMHTNMMQTISVAGMVVTLLAVLLAITVVPALIMIANRVLINPSVLTRIPGVRVITRAVGDSASDTGIFSRLARRVHAHPWVIVVCVLAVLAIMASPISALTMRTAFTDYMPEGNAVTQAYNTIQDDYPAAQAASIVVVADAPAAQTTALYQHLQSLPGQDFISPPAALPDDPDRSVINVHIADSNQVSQAITDQVTALRSYDAGYPIMVGGPAAMQHDFIQSVIDNGPVALVIMVCAVMVLLFLMTGSLIIPIKALIINSLSLLASLGATSAIFMHGWFGMPQVLGMETFIVVCAICFGFGLAMDYEVFLLARIKEAWDVGLPNDLAVERGLQRSGRIITSAAAIIVAVFIGFTFGRMTAIKEVGVALAITVITDATLVRMLLVPATMTILGRWNWWAPGPLRKLYGHLKIIH